MEEKEKLSNRLTAAILKDLRLEIEQCSKYQLIFVTAKEVLSKPFLFWLKKIKKEKKTALSLHSITRDQHRYINKCAKSSL